ncbi:MAG: XrtA/PEP-CTERM system TPR-repeat protein PrsT [Candidatus Reddybacter sp.]
MKLMDSVLLKRLFLIPLLTLLVVSLSACDGFGRTPVEYIESARTYLDQGDFPAAIVELKSALQQDSSNIEARKLLGDTYLQIGKGEDAEKELRRAINLGMSPASGATALAHALLLQGEFQQVLDSPVELGAVAKTDQAELSALRGNAHFGLGNLTLAENLYEVAIVIDSNSREALLGKSKMKASRGGLAGATVMAKGVVEDDPAFAPAWEFLGDLAQAQDQLDDAEAMYSAAIEQSPYLADSILKRAGVRLQKEDYTGLKEDVDVLVNAGYLSPHLSYFKGRVDFFNESYRDAEQAFNGTLELNPKFWPAKVYLASTHLHLGQQQQALDLAQQLQSDAPDRQYLKGLLGATYANVGQFSQAKKALNDLLSANPHNVYALSLLAQILLNEGRADEAQAYLTRALSITPESKNLQQNLEIAKMMSGTTLEYNSTDYDIVFMAALAEFKKGDYQKALDIAQQLHKDKPNSVDPLNLSAAARLGLFDLSGAKKAFEQVLALEANNPTAAKNLAIIEWRAGNLDRAEEILAKYLSENPQDETAVLKQAAIQFQLKKPGEGIALLRETLEQNSGSTSIPAILAQHYFDTQRYEELLSLTSNLKDQQFQAQPVLWALRGRVNLLRNEKVLARDAFKKYATLLPESAHAHFLYADALSRSGQKYKQKARHEIERTVSVDATYLPGRIGQVKMLIQHQELGEAKLAMEKIKKDFGEVPAVLGLEGWLALGVGDLSSAEKSLSAAIEQSPNSEITLLLFRSLWRQGKYEQAYDALTVRLEQRPKELALLEELGAAKLAQNKEREALEIYRLIIKDHPKHIVALNNLAWLSRSEDLDQAIAYAEHAAELAPGAVSVADTLAMLLLQKDSGSQRALQLLEKAAKQAPESPEIQLHYGVLLIQRSLFVQARDVLNSVVKSSAGTSLAAEATELLAGLPSDSE